MNPLTKDYTPLLRQHCLRLALRHRSHSASVQSLVMTTAATSRKCPPSHFGCREAERWPAADPDTDSQLFMEVGNIAKLQEELDRIRCTVLYYSASLWQKQDVNPVSLITCACRLTPKLFSFFCLLPTTLKMHWKINNDLFRNHNTDNRKERKQRIWPLDNVFFPGSSWTGPRKSEHNCDDNSVW